MTFFIACSGTGSRVDHDGCAVRLRHTLPGALSVCGHRGSVHQTGGFVGVGATSAVRYGVERELVVTSGSRQDKRYKQPHQHMEKPRSGLGIHVHQWSQLLFYRTNQTTFCCMMDAVRQWQIFNFECTSVFSYHQVLLLLFL
jgi:hypothetical protein